MFRKVKNIVSGNLYSWNTNHNEKAVSRIYENFSVLSVGEKEIANQILASSSVLLGTIFGPERKKLTVEKITDKQMRGITSKQHYSMLIYCFEMFVRMFGLSKSYNEITYLYKKAFGKNFVGIDSFENNKDGLKELIKFYSKKVASTSGIVIENDPVFFYSFFNLATELASKLKDFLNDKK